MSSGLVPVTNKVAAIPEFVDDASGVLVEGEDSTGMANRILELINNPVEFSKLSRATSERAQLQCGFDNTIAKEINMIKKYSNL